MNENEWKAIKLVVLKYPFLLFAMYFLIGLGLLVDEKEYVTWGLLSGIAWLILCFHTPNFIKQVNNILKKEEEAGDK